jgi:hypothetical protein
MAKITLANGAVLEGTVEELSQMAKVFGVQPEPLKVGDYAKVISVSPAMLGFSVGEIVKVLRIEDSGKYKTHIQVADKIGFGDNGVHIVRATDEEVAEAKRKLAEAEVEKWAKIGRKPNEFKKGDIVKCVDSCNGHPIGTIGEVAKASNVYEFVYVNANGIYKVHTVELIAPVESRFDSDAE